MRWTIALLVPLLAAVSGCSSGPEPIASTSTGRTSSTTATTSPASTATVEATYGCGPSDASEIRVTGRSVGGTHVIILVSFDDKVYDRSLPMPGPTVGQVFETELPREAFDAGSADVRIVDAYDPIIVIASGTVDLVSGGCG